MPDRDSVVECEFGVDTATAVDSPGLDVDLSNQIRQPDKPHSAL